MDTQWVADHDIRKYDTTDLNRLAGPKYPTLYQTCLMVEWNKTLRDPDNGDTRRDVHRQFRKDYKAYKKDLADLEVEPADYPDRQSAIYGPPRRSGIGTGNSGWYRGGSQAQPSSLTVMPVRFRDKPMPPSPPDVCSDPQTSIYASAIKDRVADLIAYSGPVVTGMA